MIEWLLQKLEKDPTTLFRKRDLLDRSRSQFERLTQRGLLVYIQTDPENETYPCQLPCAKTCAMQIVEIQGQFYAMCPEDSEVDPVLLGEDDLHKYVFSVEKFLEDIRQANGLRGSLSQIEPDYSYMGYALYEGRRVGFVFVPSIKGKGLLELRGLKRLCVDDDILIALSPVSTVDDISIRADLSRDMIVQVSLAASLNLRTFKIPVSKIVAQVAEAEREWRPMPQTKVPGDTLITLTEAATLLGVNKGTVSRYADARTILDDGQQGQERRVWKSSVLLCKQGQEEEALLQDAKEMGKDAGRVPDKH